MAVNDRIADALRSLIGLPLSVVYRSAGLAVLHFGEMRSVTDRYGTGAVGTYALHIQCTWRIVGAAGVIVGWNDHYFAPGDDPHRDGDAFDWEVPAITRFDERIATFLSERTEDSRTVQAVEVGTVGSFRLVLTDATAVEVFPDTSFAEHWRVFRPGDKTSRFVFTAEGIEE